MVYGNQIKFFILCVSLFLNIPLIHATNLPNGSNSFLTFNLEKLHFASPQWKDSSLPPIPLPKGIYSFQGQLKQKQWIKSKYLNHNLAEDAQAISDLKSKGFTCLRRSQTQTLCKTTKDQFEWPKGALDQTHRLLKGYAIHFPENPEVTLSHDGSTTQEWMVRGPLLIGETNLTVYRLTRTYEGDFYFAFPVSEENPIGYFTYHENEGLGFRLNLQGKDSEGWKLNYIFEALYEETK